MKNTKLLPYLIILFCSNQIFGQINYAGNINWSSTLSNRSALIMNINESHIILGSSMRDYQTNNEGRISYDGASKELTHYVKIDRFEFTVDSIDSSTVPLLRNFIKLNSDSYVAISEFDTLEEDTALGQEILNKGIAFGLVDFENQVVVGKTYGLLKLQDILEFVKSDSYLYILYNTTDNGSVLEKRNVSNFNLETRHNFPVRIHSSHYNSDLSEFFILTETGSNYLIKDYQTLSLGGSMSLKKANYNSQTTFPEILAVDTFLLEVVKKRSLYSTEYGIVLFGQNGDSINYYESENKLESIHLYNDNWIVISHNDSDSIATPLKVSILNQNFSPLWDSAFGLESVIYQDSHISEGELFISGITNKHYGYQGISAKDEIYLIALGLDDILSQEEFHGIKVYPNPTKKEAIILESSDVNFLEDDLQNVKISTLSGELISPNCKPLSKNTIEIDTSQLSSGIHIIYIALKNKTVVSKKFIVK